MAEKIDLNTLPKGLTKEEFTALPNFKKIRSFFTWAGVECKILTIFEAGKQDYIALMPLDEKGNENADGEVYIYRYSEDEDGNPSLDNIDSDEEYEVVSDRFDELLDEAEFDAMDN